MNQHITTPPRRRKTLGIVLLSFVLAVSVAFGIYFLVPKSTAIYAEVNHSGHTESDNWLELTSDYVDSSNGKTAGYIVGSTDGEETTYYYLASDVTLSTNNITISGNVTLCLNGNVLTGTGNGSVITVEEGASLTLCDCQEGSANNEVGDITYTSGVITGGTGDSSNNGGGVYVKSNAEFIMQSGTIAGNTVSNSGGGVYVESNANFTMSGGSISGNTASSGGGGVYFYGDTFTMTGGYITNNTAQNGGGVRMQHASTFNMTGGEISGNTATTGSGGGVNVISGTFNMSGGTISNNSANSGGVNVEGTFTMSGGTISNNDAIQGGGVYVGSTTTSSGEYVAGEFNMSGDSYITNNTAISSNGSGSGGGVYVEGKFTMSGGEISGNQAGSGTGYGGGVHVAGALTSDGEYVGGEFTMEDGKISENSACYGGGVCVGSEAVFNMSGGSITDNEATNSGGGVRVQSSSTITVEGEELVLNSGTFNMSGGTIGGTDDDGNATGNTALYGGGVDTEGTFNMYSGIISNNWVTLDPSDTNKGGNGGGVHVAGTFTMTGGSITYNEAPHMGGGVHVSNGATFTMEDGSITYNEAGYGGGIATDGKVDMSGGTIAYNTAIGQGDAVYVGNQNYETSAAFVMSGGFLDGTVILDYHSDTVSSDITRGHLSESAKESAVNGGFIKSECGAYGDNDEPVYECGHYDDFPYEVAVEHDPKTVPAKSATCMEDGWYAYEYCQRDGCSYSTIVTIPATGEHSWDDGVVTTEATCVEDGVKTYTCTVCEATKTEEIPATGEHSWDEWEADDESTHTRECEVCDATETGVHTYGTWKDNGDDATYSRICEICDYSEMGLHHFIVSDVSDDAMTYMCGYCGAKLVVESDDGSCSHVGVVMETTYTKKATCTSSGYYTIVVKCEVCGSKLASTIVTIPATGHTYEKTTSKEATCTEEGYITYTCENCDESFTITLEKTAHTIGDSVKENEVLATCTEEGSYDLVIYCSECSEELFRTQITVSATGHNYGDDGVCTECGDDEGDGEGTTGGDGEGTTGDDDEGTTGGDDEGTTGGDEGTTGGGDVTTGDDNDSDDSNLLLLIAILLAILFVCLIIIIIVICLKKKSKEDDEEDEKK